MRRAIVLCVLLPLSGCEAIEREQQRKADLIAECANRVVARTGRDSVRSQTACLTIEQENAEALRTAIIMNGAMRR